MTEGVRRLLYDFHRLLTPSTACGRSPSLEEGGLWGGKIESLQNIGGRAMRAPTILRKKGTAHYAAVPVGARIARPRFVQYSLFAQLLSQNQEIHLFFHLQKGLFSPPSGGE